MAAEANNVDTIPCEVCTNDIPLGEYVDHQIAHSIDKGGNNNNNNANMKPKAENLQDVMQSKGSNKDNVEQNENEQIEQNDDNNNNSDKMKIETESKENDESKDEYITSYDDNLLDRAYGLCIGAGIGDSIGSYCEFRNQAVSSTELDVAMKMPGGGTWGYQVKTGQVTDDTELAISLSYALCEMCQKNKGKKFDLRFIANEYNKWNSSNPFDRGFCTRAVLFFAPDVVRMKKKAISYDVEKKTQYKSEGNLANGALMRCMPLVLYGYNLKDYDNLYTLMKMDAGLTHANYYVFIVNTCYAIMSLYLLKCDINEKDKNKNAYNEMYGWLEKQTKKKKQTKNDSDRCEAAKIIFNDWLGDVKKALEKNDLNELQIATKFKGFVKIAFQRVCYHLLNNTSYSDSIRQTVGEGGDSDTNACIVGGMMGSYHGLKGIPNYMIENIHKCKPRRIDRDRFQAKWYFKKKMIETILNNAPNDQDFLNGLVKYPMNS